MHIERHTHKYALYVLVLVLLRTGQHLAPVGRGPSTEHTHPKTHGAGKFLIVQLHPVDP